MKFASLDRLRHLGAIRDARRAAYLALEDDRQHLRERMNAAKRDRATIARDIDPRMAAPRLDELDALTEHLTAEMAALGERHEAAASEHRAAAGAFARARDYALEHDLPVPSGEGEKTWMGSTAAPVPAPAAQGGA